jgi:hypothetical protein
MDDYTLLHKNRSDMDYKLHDGSANPLGRTFTPPFMNIVHVIQGQIIHEFHITKSKLAELVWDV